MLWSVCRTNNTLFLINIWNSVGLYTILRLSINYNIVSVKHLEKKYDLILEIIELIKKIAKYDICLKQVEYIFTVTSGRPWFNSLYDV